MRLKFLYSMVVVLVALVLASCNAVDTVVKSKADKSSNSPVSPQTTYADGARRITTEELATLMKEGKAYVIDTRNQAMYDVGHIPGSRLIPAAEILNHLNELPRDKTIVTYCS
ncbi:MAG TPA: rhodanese-like domain-containing protein [Pyrinomonadaceae bacterium]|nr:rhodanese-like domain-containing protein [Pyrinomonadaceae bacterium]